MNTKQLQTEIARLKTENEALKLHQPYGILTRAGFELEKRTLADAQYAVFGDIDNMHGLNVLHGYETVNQMIRNALSLRHDDLLLTGLWFSGDEIVFIIKSNPEGFITRLRESFQAHSMSITLAAAPISNGEVNNAIDQAAQVVQAHKQSRR